MVHTRLMAPSLLRHHRWQLPATWLATPSDAPSPLKTSQAIIAAYNQDKDRATIEDTFAKLINVLTALDVEHQRAVQEGLSEDQLALFNLVQRGDLNKTERESIKPLSRD